MIGQKIFYIDFGDILSPFGHKKKNWKIFENVRIWGKKWQFQGQLTPLKPLKNQSTIKKVATFEFFLEVAKMQLNLYIYITY